MNDNKQFPEELDAVLAPCIKIERSYYPTHTYGRLTLLLDGKRVFKCFTIEKPDKDNKQNVSCIPEGKYKATRIDWSTKSKGMDTFLLEDVPGRSAVQIHVANVQSELQGCIAPGKKKGVLFNEAAVLNSKNALEALMEKLAGVDSIRVVIKKR